MTRLIVLMLVLATSTPVLADQKADLVARANKEFEQGKYEDALKTLEAAYAIDPDPGIVFALGQVHMKLGDCKQAIAYYRSFLATKPDPKQAATVYKAIDRCKMMKMEAEPKPEPVEPVKPVKPEPEPEPPKPEPPKPPAPVTPSSEHVPWYRDVVGDVLIVGGIAGGVVSALMYRSARTHRENADAALSYVEYSDELATSKRNQKIAIGAAGGAVALLALGVVRFSLRDSTSERVDVAVTNTGAVASWRVRF
jgi:tetratricopeptide (TPR) repeat protein